MKKRAKLLGALAIAGALVVGTAAPAMAAYQNMGSQTCSGGLRAAVYAGSASTITISQFWSGGDHTQVWQNGASTITRVKVVPIGVARMTKGEATTSAFSFTNLGKDCRAF